MAKEEGKIRLHFKEGPVELKPVRVTGRVQDDALLLLGDLKADERQEKMQEIALEIENSKPEDKAAATARFMVLLNQPASASLAKSNRSVKIELIKLMADTSTLTPGQTEEYHAPEFWDDQAVEDIQAAFIFFRGLVSVV